MTSSAEAAARSILMSRVFSVNHLMAMGTESHLALSGPPLRDIDTSSLVSERYRGQRQCRSQSLA